MENIITIAALVLLALGSLLLLGRQGVLRFALRLLPNMILEAEETLGAGTGAQKKETVLAELQKALPVPLRPLLSQKLAEVLLEEVLAALRELGEIADKEDAV